MRLLCRFFSSFFLSLFRTRGTVSYTTLMQRIASFIYLQQSVIRDTARARRTRYFFLSNVNRMHVASAVAFSTPPGGSLTRACVTKRRALMQK